MTHASRSSIRFGLLLAVLLLYETLSAHAAAAAPHASHGGASGQEAGNPDARTLDRFFPRTHLQIATPDARLHDFEVWVADNDARRARGFMHIRQLDADAGMLFVFPQQGRIAMWMKNTYVSLDMLFVRADGTVDHVVEHTKPLSLQTIESANPVTAVIELKAGTAGRFGIRAGARVMHPAFATR